MRSLAGIPRIPSKTIETIAVQGKADPAIQTSINRTKIEQIRRNKLHSLVPQDSNSLDAVPFVLEFKPEMCYYCLKDLSVNRVNRNEFQKHKATQAYIEETIQSQSLAAVHYNPENILKRMSFRWVTTQDQQPDANIPEQTKGESQ